LFSRNNIFLSFFPPYSYSFLCWWFHIKTTQVEGITKLLAASIQASVWRVRVAIAMAAGKVLVKLVPSVSTSSNSVEELVTCLRMAADDIKFHQVRQSAIGSLLLFLKRASVDAAVAKMCSTSSVSQIKIIVRLLRDDGDPLTAQKAGEAALELEKFVK
jgi:hypothetical protein